MLGNGHVPFLGGGMVVTSSCYPTAASPAGTGIIRNAPFGLSPNNVCYSRIVRFASIPNNIHVTLVLLAAAYLSGICAQAHVSCPVAGLSVPVLLPLTVPEVRHLLARLIWPASSSVRWVLAWSWWRRVHQSWASYYHTKRRLKAG